MSMQPWNWSTLLQRTMQTDEDEDAHPIGAPGAKETYLLYSHMNFGAADRHLEPKTRQVSVSKVEDMSRRYQKVREENCTLRRESFEVTKYCDALENMLEANERFLRDVQRERDEFMKEAKLARKIQVCAEEKFRRQTEILNKTTTELNEALQENHNLTLQKIKLQKWTERSDDDEISQAMGELCQQLEAWAKHHFPRSAPKGREFYWFCALVSNRVTVACLSRILVGVVGDAFEAQVLCEGVHSLDQKVEKICR